MTRKELKEIIKKIIVESKINKEFWVKYPALKSNPDLIKWANLQFKNANQYSLLHMLDVKPTTIKNISLLIKALGSTELQQLYSKLVDISNDYRDIDTEKIDLDKYSKFNDEIKKYEKKFIKLWHTDIKDKINTYIK